jgi:hypothetical protein
MGALVSSISSGLGRGLRSLPTLVLPAIVCGLGAAGTMLIIAKAGSPGGDLRAHLAFGGLELAAGTLAFWAASALWLAVDQHMFRAGEARRLGTPGTALSSLVVITVIAAGFAAAAWAALAIAAPLAGGHFGLPEVEAPFALKSSLAELNETELLCLAPVVLLYLPNLVRASLVPCAAAIDDDLAIDSWRLLYRVSARRFGVLGIIALAEALVIAPALLIGPQLVAGAPPKAAVGALTAVAALPLALIQVACVRHLLGLPAERDIAPTHFQVEDVEADDEQEAPPAPEGFAPPPPPSF